VYSRAHSGYNLRLFCVNSLKKQQKKIGKMTLHLHFTLKISADLFGSLEIKLSAQPSFENLKEFGFSIAEQHLS
jgi:hypothetical protein